MKKLFFPFLLFLAACSPPQTPISTTTTTLPVATAFETSSPTPTETKTPSPTATSTVTITPKATKTPVYTILRGKVLVRANCRYGPGAPYLYKYGLIPESNLEVIGRLDDATWIQVQAIGGDNPCWVKASLLKLQGNVFSVAPVYPNKAPLPISPYYNAPIRVEATIRDELVTITWIGQSLRAGDRENEYSPIYLVEVWACEDKTLKFTPYGLLIETLTITNESGCTEKAHARIYFAEKHGYAGPVEIEFSQ